MKYKLFLIMSFFIANNCLAGFLAPTISKFALTNTGLASSIAATLGKNVQPATFKTSKEQEFIDFAKHLQNNHKALKDKSFKEIENLLQQEENNFKKNLIFPFSKISDYCPNLNNKIVNDISKIFEVLKTQMNLPNEIQLYSIMSNHLPYDLNYMPAHRIVYIKNHIVSKTPIIILFLLAHELSHAQQHQQKGLVEMMRMLQENRAILERDADTKATDFIKCPLCMKAITATYLLEHPIDDSLGYFTSHDFKKSLEQKSLTDLCSAHQTVKNPDIWSGLDTPEGCKKIVIDDCKIGSILDRLL